MLLYQPFQVLIVEQMLTTGGGWQDQVNGLYPGIKRGRTAKRETDLRVSVEQVALDDDFAAALGGHMLLVFTGKVRLAKNLLRVNVYLLGTIFKGHPKKVCAFRHSCGPLVSILRNNSTYTYALFILKISNFFNPSLPLHEDILYEWFIA